MIYYSVSAFINFFVSFILGIIVLYINPKSKMNRNLFFWCISVAFWSLFYFIWQLETKEDDVMLWVRLLMLGAIWVPVFYFKVVVIFLKISDKYKFFIYTTYFLSVGFSALLLTPLMISGIEPVAGFNFWPKAGDLYFLFIMMFGGITLYGAYLAYSNLKKESSLIRRSQIKYMLFGMMVSIIGGSTNYFLWYDINIPPFGNILAVVYVITVVYAITKHKLFNVKVIVTELLVFIIGVILVIRLSLVDSIEYLIVESITLVLIVVLGIFLIKSVKNEVKRREEMEGLALKLKKANKKLEEINEAKSDFIAIASHQLRTPLTAIKGYTSMILDGTYGDAPEKIETVIDRIFQSSQRLVIIVNDLLNVSRIEKGRIKYDLEDVDLAVMLKDVIEDFAPRIKKKELELIKNINLDNVIISADKGKIRQAFTNILDNSIKYTDKGFISVDVNMDKDRKNILLTIKDSGIGIDKESINKIFEKFTRAKDAVKSHTEGSGIGLYVAREIIRAHNGDIKVSSAGEGQGTQFFISLPIKK